MPASGACDHPFLVPSVNGSQCVMAGRLDIGRHFILTGGLDGLREPYEALVARVLSFGAYIFDLDAMPVAKELFADAMFQAWGARVREQAVRWCGAMFGGWACGLVGWWWRWW